MVRARKLVAATWLGVGLVGSGSPALAQTWVPASPRGGAVQAIAYAPSSPRTAYLATPGGKIYRSEDDAVSWRYAGTPPGALTGDLRVDPFDSETLFTRDWAGKLFRSQDGGATWAPVAINLTVNELATDSHSEGHLFAATSYQGLYRSTDHGDSWSLAAFPGAFVLSVASSPFAEGLLFSALGPSLTSEVQTLFRSTDGGVHWIQVPEFAAPLGFDSLQPHWVFDPAHPDTLYVFYAYPPSTGGAEPGPVLRSLDGGLTWTQPSTVYLRDLAVTADGTLFGTSYNLGVISSHDQGATWSPIERQIPPDLIQRVATSPAAPGTVLAAGSQGLWKSTDAGVRWRNPSRGIPITYAQSIAVAPSGPSKVVATAEGRVFASLDRGTTWSRLHSEYSGPEPYSLTFDPHVPDRIYGPTYLYVSNFPMRSDDGGHSWNALPFPYSCGGSLCSVDFGAFALDPTRPETLYVAGTYFIHFVGQGSFFLRSRDGGRSWASLVRPTDFTALGFDPSRSGVLFGLSARRLFKSTDDARTWARVGRGLPYRGKRTLAVDPRDGRRVFVGTTRGLFVSEDGGISFRPLGRALQGKSINAIVIDPIRPDRIYVSGPTAGIHRWNPRIRDFEPLEDGLPASAFGYYPLALDPREPATLYTGAYGLGVFRLEVE